MGLCDHVHPRVCMAHSIAGAARINVSTYINAQRNASSKLSALQISITTWAFKSGAWVLMTNSHSVTFQEVHILPPLPIRVSTPASDEALDSCYRDRIYDATI
jgi:hypothetical protein